MKTQEYLFNGRISVVDSNIRVIVSVFFISLLSGQYAWITVQLENKNSNFQYKYKYEKF